MAHGNWLGKPYVINMVSLPCVQVQVAGSPLYHTDKRLGKGGFGVVYQAQRVPQRVTGRPTRERDGKDAAEVGMLTPH